MTPTSSDTVLSAPAAPAHKGHTGGRQGRQSPASADPAARRMLAVAPPPGKQEPVVHAATKVLERRYRTQRTEAEKTIEDHGLTIEVTRLRDRLARAAVSDLERLLLSTPGIAEKLFNDAIEQQLRHERALADRSRDRVKDESVRGIADKIESASTSLEQSASVISEASAEIRTSTAAIADALTRMVDIVSGADRDRDVNDSHNRPDPDADRTDADRPHRAEAGAEPVAEAGAEPVDEPDSKRKARRTSRTKEQ